MNKTSVPTADKFRDAVRAGRFRDATGLLAALRSEVEAAWASSASAEERQRIASEANGLLEWARSTILASRAHTQSRLELLKRGSAYNANGNAARRPQINLEG